MSANNLKKESFIELWEKGMLKFKEGNPQYLSRICLRLKTDVQFSELKTLKCWACEQFIVNHGNCDPL